MLIKDNIKISKLNHTTKDMVIKIELNFKLNANSVNLKAKYTPDNYKLEQNSLLTYIEELLKSEEFDLENLAARIVEDLYDIAVPKKIEVELIQEIDNITTSISTQKKQPKF